MHTEIYITAPSLTCVVGIGSTGGHIEVKVCQTANALPLLRQEEGMPVAAPAGGEKPRPPFVHPFATCLSDINQQRLSNLCYWSPRGQKSLAYHLNKALRPYLALVKNVVCQVTGSAPGVHQKVPRALRANRESNAPPFVHPSVTYLSNATKLGLDCFAFFNPGLAESMDEFTNEALTQHLDRNFQSDIYERGTPRGKRYTMVKPKVKAKPKVK